MQFPHGWRSVTSHLTRLELQVTQASFARFRGGSAMVAGYAVVGYVIDGLWGRKRSRLSGTVQKGSGLALGLYSKSGEMG